MIKDCDNVITGHEMADNENMIQFIEIARNSNLIIIASYEVSYTTTTDFKSFEVNFCSIKLLT